MKESSQNLTARSLIVKFFFFFFNRALQPLVGFRPAQRQLSRKVLQSAVASGTSNPQLGGYYRKNRQAFVRKLEWNFINFLNLERLPYKSKRSKQCKLQVSQMT
jgi:hypothetical protein